MICASIRRNRDRTRSRDESVPRNVGARWRGRVGEDASERSRCDGGPPQDVDEGYAFGHARRDARLPRRTQDYLRRRPRNEHCAIRELASMLRERYRSSSCGRRLGRAGNVARSSGRGRVERRQRRTWVACDCVCARDAIEVISKRDPWKTMVSLLLPMYFSLYLTELVRPDPPLPSTRHVRPIHSKAPALPASFRPSSAMASRMPSTPRFLFQARDRSRAWR